MPKTLFFIILFSTLLTRHSFAQDILPNISVKNYNGKIIISWKNNYGAKITTLNVQRSNDSLRNFITFASVLNPMNKQNGIVDSKTPNVNMFYRVFVAFEGGTYVFSRSQRPVLYVPPVVQTPAPAAVDSQTTSTVATITTTNAVIDSITPNHITAFIPMPYVDSPEMKKPAKIIVPKPPPVVLGKFIFTGKDNNVIITLADAAKKKYSIKFFDEKGEFVFEVKKIEEPYLILDKVNFMHAGLFNYELYDDGKLLEKYRVIIPK